jgi:DNA-binding NtrC family response regulator
MFLTGAQTSREPIQEGSDSALNVRLKILVVGVSAEFTAGMGEALETEGHQILRTDSASDALMLTSQEQPDLILLDQQAEGASGATLLNALLTEQPSAGVILFARNAKVSEVVSAIRQGAADYLEGPLELETLKRAIEFVKAVL